MNKNQIIYPFSKQLMFAKVMEDEILCRDMLGIIFPGRQVKDLIVHERESSISEATIVTGMESKSVRLDVLFEDGSGWYDIELQVEDKGNLPKRSRYYGAALDVNKLKKGRDYNELEPSFIIFLCLYDEMGIDEPVYSFRMFDEKYSLPLNDERYTIILNASCSKSKIPDDLRPLFEYLNTGEIITEDEFITRIDERVRAFQDDEEIRRMMSVEDEMRLIYENRLKRQLKEGIEKGVEQELEQVRKQCIEQGLEQGLEQGIEQGELSKATEMARAMKADNEPVEKIVRYTGLSEEEIRRL